MFRVSTVSCTEFCVRNCLLSTRKFVWVLLGSAQGQNKSWELLGFLLWFAQQQVNKTHSITATPSQRKPTPEFGRVVVSFWGISQYSCNDKPRSALWPWSQIPRHTVAEWFQMVGVCGRKGVTVTSSLLRIRGFSCISVPASASKIREIAVDLDCLVLHPSWPLNRTLYLNMWFPYVMMMMPWIGTNLDTVKQHQVVYLRKVVLLYAKGRHYVNAQGRSGGGCREGLFIKWFLCHSLSNSFAACQKYIFSMF